MILDILKEEFLAKDAKEIIIQIIHSTIKYHEHKIIANLDDDEDLILRESKIIELHKYLYETQEYINKSTQPISLRAQVIL